MKQFAVLGLGDFGMALVQQLKRNKVAVLAVDVDRDRAEQIRDHVDHVVIADITQASALEKLSLPTMDAVVVATSSPMTVSILSVLRLKEIGIQRIIAKAENNDHAKVLRALGVNEIVIPEEDSAARVGSALSWSSVVAMIELSSGCAIMEVSPPEAVVGKELRNSGLRDKYQVEVLGIREEPGGKLTPIPSPDTVITSDCTLVIFGMEERLAAFRQEAERRKT